jgi:glycosyltransferase involved in cell wall biosynthesis
MSSLPKVLLVGGPDIDARLELMHSLSDRFEMSAVGSLPSLEDKFTKEGFSYYSYNLNRGVNPLADLNTFFQLITLFRRLKPQIIHAFDSKPCVWGRLAARFANIPVIIGTLPGLGSLYANENAKNRSIRFVYQELQRLTCRVSSLTIFQNEDDSRQFINTKIVPFQKSKVILGSGINTKYFCLSQLSENTKNKLKTEFNIEPDEIVVVMISRILPSKGVLEFIQSAREIQRINPKVHFLLIGGKDNESIDQLTEEEMIQLNQAVDWRGPRRDIAEILAISNIFVLPTIYREGIPRVLLEAAAMELPIITTNSPGCREVVENGVNGFLIPTHNAEALSNAILRLVKSPELCRSFGSISRQKMVQKFDINIISSQIGEVYEEYLSITQKETNEQHTHSHENIENQ